MNAEFVDTLQDLCSGNVQKIMLTEQIISELRGGSIFEVQHIQQCSCMTIIADPSIVGYEQFDTAKIADWLHHGDLRPKSPEELFAARRILRIACVNVPRSNVDDYSLAGLFQLIREAVQNKFMKDRQSRMFDFQFNITVEHKDGDEKLTVLKRFILQDVHMPFTYPEKRREHDALDDVLVISGGKGLDIRRDEFQITRTASMERIPEMAIPEPSLMQNIGSYMCSFLGYFY